MENKDSKNTKRCSKNTILAFHASLKDVKNAEKDMKSLDENLAKFFCKAKKKRRKEVQSALQPLRNGLRRHPSCPVHSFLYLEKRNNDITALWQRPLNKNGATEPESSYSTCLCCRSQSPIDRIRGIQDEYKSAKLVAGNMVS